MIGGMTAWFCIIATVGGTGNLTEIKGTEFHSFFLHFLKHKNGGWVHCANGFITCVNTVMCNLPPRHLSQPLLYFGMLKLLPNAEKLASSDKKSRLWYKMTQISKKYKLDA